MGATFREHRHGVIQATLNVAAVPAGSTNEQNFTIPGLLTTDHVDINKPSHTTGVSVANVRVSAKNTLAVTFMNSTASPVTPGPEVYMIRWVRAENIDKGVVA
jgi:hypothetical protein